MKDNRIPVLFCFLTIIQAFHSTEEIIFRLYDRFPIVTGAIHEMTGFFPVIRMSGSTFVILNVLTVAFLTVISVFVYRQKRWAWTIAKIAAVIETLNGLAHVSAAVYTGGYFPGAISGIGLIGIGIALLYSFYRIRGKAFR